LVEQKNQLVEQKNQLNEQKNQLDEQKLQIAHKDELLVKSIKALRATGLSAEEIAANLGLDLKDVEVLVER
jgi:DNA-binding transcriptional regulator YiaG